MVTRTGGMGISGVGSLQSTIEERLFWGGPTSLSQVLFSDKEVISGATRDAGATPTTDVRAGLLMGKLTSSGELEEWDGDATDGTEDLYGVLPYSFRAIDWDANDADRDIGIVVRAPLIAEQLLIQGSAFVGHIDEFVARRQLHQMGCVLNDDPQGFKTGLVTRYKPKGADYTVVEADNGSLFVSHTADTTYTLPTIHPGLRYGFIMTANQELSVASAAAGEIIGANDIAGNSITYTTTGEQIGAHVYFESIYVQTTLKWTYFIKKVAFSTDDFLAYTFAT